MGKIFMSILLLFAGMGVHASFMYTTAKEIPEIDCPARQIPVEQLPSPPIVVEAKKENWMQKAYGLYDVPSEFLDQLDAEQERMVKEYNQQYADQIRQQYRMSLLKGEQNI